MKKYVVLVLAVILMANIAFNKSISMIILSMVIFAGSILIMQFIEVYFMRKATEARRDLLWENETMCLTRTEEHLHTVYVIVPFFGRHKKVVLTDGREAQVKIYFRGGSYNLETDAINLEVAFEDSRCVRYNITYHNEISPKLKTKMTVNLDKEMLTRLAIWLA